MTPIVTSAIPDKSIAVLPFINRSNDPENEYFSDGITEEIIYALSKDSELKVIARTSSFAYKGQKVDIRTIGKQLGVATILEGSVRKVKSRVRITAQLIETREGTPLWSKNFDRELTDIFALQDEISQLIADQIREHFGHFEITDTPSVLPTRNIDAYELLLKGSYYFKRKDFDDIQRAKQYFEAAITADPTYAEAHAYLAETYLHFSGFGILNSQEAHDLARASAKQAIAVQAQSARAHKVMAYIYLFYDWDWAAARHSYDQALACGLTNENEFITYYYIFLEKDYEQALSVAKRVVETDPLHSISHWQLGLCYYFAARFGEAVRAFEHALILDETFAEAHRWRGLALAQQRQFPEALASVQHAVALMQGQGPATFNLLQVRAMMGEREAVLTEMANATYVDVCDPAELYTQLDMPEKAIDCLEQGFQQRSVMMVSLKHYWIWDSLRDHPRFEAIYQQMKFDTIRTKKTVRKLAKKILLDQEEQQRYLQQLNNLLEKEHVYLDPNLSLRGLATDIKLHPNKLSWLINEAIGKNFNEYVNTYRLVAFKQKAVDPANSHITLLGLAYESGFNSKTVFNNFFKKIEHITPRAWVKTQQDT